MNIPPGAELSKLPAGSPPHGVTPNFGDPPSPRGVILSVTIILMSITILLVAVRLLEKVKEKKVGLEDLSWTNPADDNLVNTVGRKLLDDVDAAAKSGDVFHPFKYLNYTAQCQDPINGYGSENVAKLRAASKKYDPSAIFQRAVPGGFKLP